jgi:hypothetical protein
MKKGFLNIVSISMISVMLFAVMGLQLHYHTCGKTGIRTFQIVETPECACEIEVVEHSACCHVEQESQVSCHSPKPVDNYNHLSISQLDCCQDDIFNISLESSFITSISKNLNIINCCVNIPDYNSIKIRFEQFKYKLTQVKTLLQKPRDIILEIIRIIHLSQNRNSDYLSH